MARLPIGDLPILTGASVDADADLLPIVDASATAEGTTKRITVRELLANTLSFLQSGTGPIATTVSIKNRENLSLFDFCTDAKKAAIRAGTQTDVSAEFILACAEACSSGRDLELPEGTPVISNVTLTKAIRLWGHGMRTLLYVDSAVGATTDIIKISPASGADDAISGYLLEHFYMLPVSGTPGRHAIGIDITTRPVYGSVFRKLRLGALGGKGVVTLPHATPLTDGFFTSTIEQCTIANGIYLDKAGDSIRLLNNNLTGANVGVYADLIWVSAANTAHGLDLIGNNITNSGGCVHIKNAYGARLHRNVFESSAGNANNALVDIDGTDATTKPDGVLVSQNFITAPSGVDAVRVNFARMAQIAHNLVNEPGGGAFAYKITANAADTQILYNPTSSDSSISTQLSDAGVRTVFMRHGLTGYTELTRDLFLAGSGGRIRGKDTAGTAIELLGLEIADNTVKVGAITAPATNGQCLLFAGGAEFARGNPTTLSYQTVSKIYPGTDAAARQTVSGIYAGNGAPNNANGSDGDYYLRGDGTAAGNTCIYHRQAGAWVALVTT